MSIPPFAPLTELVCIWTFPCMGALLTWSLIPCYLCLVSAPPHTVLLDMALLTTCPAYRCLLLIQGSLAFALVGATLGSGGCGGGGGGVGRWFISASKVGGRVRDGEGLG